MVSWSYMELVCHKVWEVQLEKPTVVAIYCFCLLCFYFPCIFFGNPSQFSFGESLSPFSVHITIMRTVIPDSGGRGRLVTQDNPMSFNSGSFLGTFGKMENMGWVAVKFVNLALWGPPNGELIKNGAIGESTANGWEEKLNSNTTIWAPGSTPAWIPSILKHTSQQHILFLA